MAYDAIKESPLVKATSDLLRDLSELFRMELRLAQAEISQAVAGGIQAGAWMAVAAVLGFIIALLLVQAAVFAIGSLGVALHWSALIVAAILAAAAAAAFLYGRSLARSLTPSRTLKHINRDILTAREQLK
ncbi:MAG TPA: phage holin family protein [Afifellaceae bacterium]|nr:phage holin family protein [Afifellaceae bacterium]